MTRMKVEDFVKDVEQAFATVQANGAVFIEQDNGEYQILLTEQRLRQLVGGQRNPDAVIRELMGGQRNPDSVAPLPAAGQPTPD